MCSTTRCVPTCRARVTLLAPRALRAPSGYSEAGSVLRTQLLSFELHTKVMAQDVFPVTGTSANEAGVQIQLSSFPSLAAASFP